MPSYRIFILDAETGALVRELAVPGVVELSFSAKGTYLSSWERYGASFLPLDIFEKGLTDARQRLTPPSVSGSSAKPADENAQHQNLRVFSVESGEEVMAFVQKGQENW